MRICIFGRTGQVATEIARRQDVETIGRDRADFLDPDQVARVAEEVDADAIVNAVAYTAVDKAESEPDAARRVNALSVAALARVAARRGIPLVHISTDYVFDGSGDHARRPNDPTGPLGVYGSTKLEGEEAIRAAGGVHAILRTSWVFSAHGANFVKTMLRLGRERRSLNIVADQIGGPTPAADIATACLGIAARLVRDPAAGGTYHFSGAPDTSWAGFARAIFEEAGLDVAVTDIPSSDYPTPAVRPLNSRLDCSATEDVFGLARPDWRSGLARVLAELSEAESSH